MKSVLLRHELPKPKRQVAQIKTENVRLKQAINLDIYSQDNFDQYNPRENTRI